MTAEQPAYGRGDRAAVSRIQQREGKCFGRSAVGGPVKDCARNPRYVTVQENGANAIYACSHHLTWLVNMRTSPGHAITVRKLDV